MAASDKTVEVVVEQVVRWQRKHKLADGQIEELLRWVCKAKGNASFEATVRAILDSYKGYPRGR